MLKINILSKIKKKWLALSRAGCIVAIAIITLIMPSCSTGIESTKKIRMNKEDMKLMVKSDEQVFASEIKGTPLSTWEKGKPFIALSERTPYIFQPYGIDPSNSDETFKGKILRYSGTESMTTPGLSEECAILFSDGKNNYRYLTGKTTKEAMSDIDSSKLPLLSDVALIEEWKQKIIGKTLWTKTNLWEDETGNRISGLKFTKVKIVDVIPSTGDFPMKAKILTHQGDEAYIQMNYTADSHDSRNFAAIFYLNDPKIKYPNISDENWVLIQNGKVGIGMTKEECKLSLGNPDELNAGHSAFQTMDIWQYTNGTYLMFTDGLLTRFRQ